MAHSIKRTKNDHHSYKPLRREINRQERRTVKHKLTDDLSASDMLATHKAFKVSYNWKAEC